MAVYQGNILERIVSLDKNVTNIGEIIIGPLRKREGAAIAQLFKQFLMHSVKGSAISGVKIDGVLHAFAVIPHVKEDVNYLISNLKKVVVKREHFEGNAILTLHKQGRGPVKAGDFKGVGITIVNPDLELCTITDDGSISLECLVTSGQSYVSEEEMKKIEDNNSMILFGSSYGPVQTVSYDVRELSVGRTDTLEELVLKIETNGSISPLEAVKEAAARLAYTLDGFLKHEAPDVVVLSEPSKQLPFDEILLTKIEKLKLSGRAQTCVNHYKLRYLGELVMLTSDQLIGVPHVGRISVNEIKDRLSEYGLTLESIVAGWPTGEELDNLAAAYEAKHG